MSSLNFDVYMPVIILMAFAVIMVLGALLVGYFLRPSNPTELKQSEYECGEAPIGSAWSFFHVRFYVVALIFIIFDVESALMLPVASVYKKLAEIGQGGPLLASLFLFIAILVAGLVYCWKKGDLDWVRSYHLKNNIEGERS